ncbi:MAG: beta-ketoacyl-ACP synthase [Gammaproteobacteria bacterium]|nr:beta-ketoacyl-ACP synthase [Gammaproteobacteria bacterium]MDH3372027.1 beta-ketoacyl-ACP synthase [Gammaproteobacteria bacterium]MDH3410204.1 beta-ketoacyl-ACP synthase [Gammaproteobacteria bacterium]
MTHRVVVTGVGAYSPVGNNWTEIEHSFKNLKNGVRHIDAWDEYDGLNTKLGAPVASFEMPASFNRKRTRSMGRVALLATAASEKALLDAGLLGDPVLKSGRVGVAYGSSTGSTDAAADFVNMLRTKCLDGITATTYIRMMGHTTPVNIGVFFGLQGRVVTTSSACTSGSQGIGYAYEAIRSGSQDMMLAGGAEELCPTEAAVFDTLYATSTCNDKPETSPRPFDRDRDGLVIGEGACTLVLERRDHARARGAKIYAELVGFDTNSDGAHVTQPAAETMQRVMELSLADAGLGPEAIGYVSAHGTATDRGDIAESHATHNVFGDNTPISSIKSYMGHTLGACGALESWLAIEMMNNGWFAPTINLDNVDPECAPLDYIRGAGRKLDVEYIMNNNFAFGGINTSLIFRRHA